MARHRIDNIRNFSIVAHIDHGKSALELNPSLRVSKLKELFPLLRSEDIAGWAECLRKAGLPE